jgi:hypothetical protein
MPMIDDETFFAWLDGELEPAEAARIEATVAADPELTRKANEHRQMTAGLRNAFGTIADAPVPTRISDGVGGSAGNIVSLSAHREKKRVDFGAPQWAAMAATLALGIGLGTMTNNDRQADPVQVSDGKLYAAAAVGHALETQLASAPATDVRIGLTYRDQQGAICRTFTTQASSGLACRDRGRWKLRGLFAAPEGQEDGYRMAGGVDPRLMDMVDESIAGEPFIARKEKHAKERGWR